MSSSAVNLRLRIVAGGMLVMLVFMLADAAYLSLVSGLEFWTGDVWQTWFYHVMFLLHVVVGLLLAGLASVFIVSHARRSWSIPNATARRLGLMLTVFVALIAISGLLLVRIVGTFDLAHPLARAIVYWLHVITPVVGLWLFWLHRLAGRPINWQSGGMTLGATVGLLAGFAALGLPGQGRVNPEQRVAATAVALTAQSEPGDADLRLNGDQFSPALTRTSTGQTIPAEHLMNDQFCKECHADVHARWDSSVHHFSSFNNPAYLASVEQTKALLLKRDGNTDAVRWCAGCHDPVPLASGRLDDPQFDVATDPTAHAGITCTVCHAISEVGSTRGNGDYMLDDPQRYPFAHSDNRALQWINRQMIKAKPALHKQTFLKPLHKTAEFCSVCHKVSLPKELNDYKDFLRGQNHYDNFLLSGVSGHGARSFYYPQVAQKNCNGCHMPAQLSNDIAAQPIGPDGQLAVHDHLFPAANTAIPWLLGRDEIVREQQEFLQDCVRIDLFGLREDGRIDGTLIAPLRPQLPRLIPGKTYLLETVVRTLTVGHLFSQGTTDSNEIWVHLRMTTPDRAIGQRTVGESGAVSPEGVVDPTAHFINAFVIDRFGNRIARRNTQDIFVKVYDHQIPPGAGQTIHYEFTVPADLTAELTISAEVLYRKFDAEYMQFVAEHTRASGDRLRGDDGGDRYINPLPISILATDQLTLPVQSSESNETIGGVQISREIPDWQRWNDYGIGLFLKGKAELRQAEEAFAEVEKLGYSDGPMNLARCYYREGRLDDAVAALKRASEFSSNPPPPWTLNYLVGLVNQEQGNLEAAEQAFRSVLETVSEETQDRGFDFSRDYLVRNQLGATLFGQAQRFRTVRQADEKRAALLAAKMEFAAVLEEDSENLQAHYNLSLIDGALGNLAASQRHQRLATRYQPDYNAQDQAVRLARERYPQADAAAEPITIYRLTPSQATTVQVD